jgi:hypothetical protein
MTTKNTVPFIARQGDVLIERIAALPAKLTQIARSQGLVILARGEVTGHHHAISARGVTQFAEPGVANPVETGQPTYLEIAEAMAELTHQEHATIELPPGAYKITRQREYSPAAIRRVAD